MLRQLCKTGDGCLQGTLGDMTEKRRNITGDLKFSLRFWTKIYVSKVFYSRKFSGSCLYGCKIVSEKFSPFDFQQFTSQLFQVLSENSKVESFHRLITSTSLPSQIIFLMKQVPFKALNKIPEFTRSLKFIAEIFYWRNYPVACYSDVQMQARLFQPFRRECS